MWGGQARKEAKAAAATAEVERLKGKGNKAFAASNFEDAVAFFGDAIALDKVPPPAAAPPHGA